MAAWGRIPSMQTKDQNISSWLCISPRAIVYGVCQVVLAWFLPRIVCSQAYEEIALVQQQMQSELLKPTTNHTCPTKCKVSCSSLRPITLVQQRTQHTKQMHRDTLNPWSSIFSVVGQEQQEVWCTSKDSGCACLKMRRRLGPSCPSKTCSGALSDKHGRANKALVFAWLLIRKTFMPEIVPAEHWNEIRKLDTTHTQNKCTQTCWILEEVIFF